MAVSEQRDPERVGREGQKLTWEEAKEAELKRNALEREAKQEGQQLALAHILRDDQRAGKGKVEIEQHRKLIEEEHRQQRNDLLDKQQERFDRLELLYRGPPSERER
jgi:hypothetical protein